MRWTRRVLYLVALGTLIAFPYGPLFPWSPLRPGYDTLHFTRADVVFPSGVAIDPAYLRVDEFISQAEQFHALPMPHRITVIACRDWSDFQRFVPQIRGRAVGAVTIQTGTAILVTPKLRENNLDAAEFLRHEISHAALHQNQSILDAYRIEQQQWFCEGLAVLFGRQRSYLSAAEFADRARLQDLAPLFDGSQQRDMRLAYQAWRFFLQYTIDLRGREMFLGFERACIHDPAGCRADYGKIYGRPLEQAIGEFQQAIRQGWFVPRD